METGRGFQRLVGFSDGVVAIALTLLVLPLVDIPPTIEHRESIRALFDDHSKELFSFLISFLVIWALWTAHHRTMQNFRGYDEMMVRLHMLWLLTIVVLPFTTQLLNSVEYREGAIPLYIANLLLSSLALVGISWRGRRHQELLHADDAEVRDWLNEPLSFVVVSIFLLALVASLLIPPVGVWPLLLLLVDDPIDRFIARFRRRRSASTAEDTTS